MSRSRGRRPRVKLASEVMGRYSLRPKADVVRTIREVLGKAGYRLNTRRIKDIFIVVASSGKTTVNFVYQLASETDKFVVDCPSVFYVDIEGSSTLKESTRVALTMLALGG